MGRKGILSIRVDPETKELVVLSTATIFCSICEREVPADLAEVYESGEAVCNKCLALKAF